MADVKLPPLPPNIYADSAMGIAFQQYALEAIRLNAQPVDAQAQSCVPAGTVLTPVELLKRAESSLGSFCSDHGWGDADMQTMDDISGLLAAAPAAPEQQEPKCRHCGGSGTAPYQSVGRRGTAETIGPCATCKGTGGVAQAPNAQQAEPALKPMTAHRAVYFMQRFRNEEKLLGPNEQAALRFTIDALEAMETQRAEAQEPCAMVNISDDDFDLGLTDDYAFGLKRLPNGQHPLFTRPQPAQLQARIAELESQLAAAKRQMESQKDEWLAWEAKRRDLENDAERYRWLLANYARGDGYDSIDRALNDGEPDVQLSPAIDAAIARTKEQP